MALYKRGGDNVVIYIKLQDETSTTFEGTREEAKNLFKTWSGKPGILIFPRTDGPNPIDNITLF